MPVVVSVAPAASVRDNRVLPLVPTQHTLCPSSGGSVRRRLGKIRNALGKAILAFAVSGHMHQGKPEKAAVELVRADEKASKRAVYAAIEKHPHMFDGLPRRARPKQKASCK